MPALIDRAREATQHVAALLWDTIEDGDLTSTVAEAMLSGHALVLIGEDETASLARDVAAALRPESFAPWPPVLSVTPDTDLLMLLGRDYGVDDPLRLQCDVLLRQGDVALLLPSPEPGEELLGLTSAIERCVARPAVLGPDFQDLNVSPRITLPDGPPACLHTAQRVLALALADALRQLLPVSAPADVPAALDSFRCGNCAAPLLVPAHLAGRLGTCPYCHNNTPLGQGVEDAPDDPRRRLRFTLRDCQVRVALAPPDRRSEPIDAHATLENLSRSGLLVALAAASAQLHPGDPLRIEIDTPAFASPLVVLGTVVRVTREGPIQHVAVSFVSLEPTVAERLHILEQDFVLRNVTRHAPAPEAGS
jgi:hypothetical protein